MPTQTTNSICERDDMYRKYCFIVAVLAVVLLNGVTSAEEENLSISGKLITFPGIGIDRTLPLQSNELIQLHFDVHGLRARNFDVMCDLCIVLEQEGSVIDMLTERMRFYSASDTSRTITAEYAFPPQKPGKYTAKATLRSEYNEETVSCQIPIEVVEDRDLRLFEVCFLASPRKPRYPVFLEGEPVIVLYTTQTSGDNPLTVEFFWDDESRPVIHDEIRLSNRLQPISRTIAVNGTGKHKVTIKAHDAQGRSVQYVMPLFIVPKSTFEDAAPTAPAE